MSGVTIHDLVNEPMRTQEDYDKWEVVRSTEIVPRKMVEMIIEKCDRDIEVFNGDSNIYEAVRVEARRIKNYAESLLKEFEEDKDDEDVTCNTQVDEKSSEEEPIFGQAFDPD